MVLTVAEYVVVTLGAGTVIGFWEPESGGFQVILPTIGPDMVRVMGGFVAYLQIRVVLAVIWPATGLQSMRSTPRPEKDFEQGGALGPVNELTVARNHRCVYQGATVQSLARGDIWLVLAGAPAMKNVDVALSHGPRTPVSL